MPYQTRWYIPNRIAYTQFYGHITAEDYEDAAFTMKQLVAEGTPQVHYIVDFLAVESVPDRVQFVKQSLSAMELSRCGWAVFVNSDRAYVRFQAFTMAQTTGMRYREVTSFHDAADFLMQADKTLLTSTPDRLQ